MRTIVCDTGPILHLLEADLLSILHLAGELHIPPVVAAELERLISGWSPEDVAGLQVRPLEPGPERKAARWQQLGLLDPGEAQAISLAQQLKADWLLTDDSAARLCAQSEGLEVHGSLGVVLWAAAATREFDLVSAHAALDRLASSSLWISERVLKEARSALSQICSR